MKNQSTLKFHIDVVKPNIIRGWVWYTDGSNNAPIVEIRNGDEVLWKTVANQYREDLLNSKIGNGTHGFSLIPDNSVLKESINSIDIYIDGKKVKEALPFDLKVELKKGYRVSLDEFSIDSIKGWAFKKSDNKYRARITVKSGDAVIASGLANNFRQDLLNKGIGDGSYGFVLTPNIANLTATEYICNLYIDDVKSEEIDPFTLIIDQEKLHKTKLEAEFPEQIKDFSQNLKNKLAKLEKDVVAANSESGKEKFAIDGQLQVVMSQIAELYVKVDVIEKVLVRHLSDKVI